MIGKVKRLKYDGKAKAMRGFGHKVVIRKDEMFDYLSHKEGVTLYRQDKAVMTFRSDYVKRYFEMYPYRGKEVVEEVKGLDEFLQQLILQNNIDYALDQKNEALFLAITNKRKGGKKHADEVGCIRYIY